MRIQPAEATFRPAEASLQGVARARIMGASVAAVNETEAVRVIVDAAVRRRGSWTITANLDHLRRYRRDSVCRELIDGADLVLADGTPLVWASRLAGTALPERVAGSNMIWSISAAASRNRASVYLLGGAPGVADRAARILTERYAGLSIVGTSCPRVGFEQNRRELDRIQGDVEAAAPDIVFVALGFPKQDMLIRALRRLLPCASFVGVGIGLSFVAGELRRAPRWMQRLGLEWMFRLAQEPRRLSRRYLLQGAPFVLWLLACALRQRLRTRHEDAGWGWTSVQPNEVEHTRPARIDGQPAGGLATSTRKDEPSAQRS